MQENLFGELVEKDVLLRDKFIEPPFTVLDTKSSQWQNRKKKWIATGIKSEVGRDATVIRMDTTAKDNNHTAEYTSVFDPALCELMYRWFTEEGDEILDPFAGGSVRGIVANYLKRSYTGIDIRHEQILSNREQAEEILPKDNQPYWYTGDSDVLLEGFSRQFDFIFSCPPYADLEKYSSLLKDISNMKYPEFLIAYRSIIKKSCSLLKKGKLACFVVGEVRDSDGHYYGLIPDTIDAFVDAGMKLYNDAILLNPVASASMRASNNMKYLKLVKTHQNVLMFKKL